ncbi:hypothetical protein GCM10007164_01900 [Luteimonas padinae]|uniref:Preprotein translocase subunit SecD n=1 Tax=Luteimonas padinae TaxID=1714359 RepID=A0ABV6SXP8_9GAMM|nr:hypothetical protein [Luteimonas padinae]GHD65149.1 hypothetical protein GCM10007164_01900 [Luteimonas padinae]
MKIRDARRIGWPLLVTALLALAAVGWTAPSEAAEPALPDGWVPVSPERLGAMRGGYALPSGLVVAFGFERQAWVNGALVASLKVDIPDVGRMSAAEAGELAQLQQTRVVQVGPGNLDALAGGAGLVIQNTLDSAQIRVQTTVDAATRTLGLLQAMHFSEALGRAGLGAAGGP